MDSETSTPLQKTSGNSIRVRDIAVRGACPYCNNILSIEASKQEKNNISDIFINLGCEVHFKDADGKTALQYSVEQNNLTVTRKILQVGINLSGESDLLLVAAKNEFPEMVDLLIEFGADVNARDEFGQTALHLCIIQDKSQSLQRRNSGRNMDAIEGITKTLLNEGADVNALTRNGFSPLHYAVNFGYLNIVKILLQFKANVHLLIEEYVKHAETGKCFCMGDQLNFRSSQETSGDGLNDNLTTILHVAVRNKSDQIILTLLEFGAKVNAEQFDGKTPLALAIERGYEEIVSILLDHNADVNIRDTSGNTPLHYAVKQGNASILHTLLKREVEIDRADSNGESPLMLAVRECREEFIRTLIDHGADIEHKNKYGMTALHVATYQTREKSVAILLSEGADINAVSDKGEVPYKLALKGKTRYPSWEGHVQILLQLQGFIHNMRMFGLYLHQYNRDMECYIKCCPVKQLSKKEVEDFKKRIVYNNITIDHILQHLQDPVYVANPDIVQRLNNIMDDLKDKNPQLKSILKYITRKAHKRFELLNDGDEWMINLIKCSENRLPMLPKETIRKIFHFLTEEEIKKAIFGNRQPVGLA